MIFVYGGAVLSSFVALFLGIAPLIYLYFKNAYSFWSKKNVLSIPPEMPFGNFKPMLWQKKFIGENLTELYNKVKDLGKPYVGVYMFWRPVLLLTDPELVKLVMTKEFQHFSSRGPGVNAKIDPLSANLVNINGHDWKFMRSKLSPTFSSGKMKMMFHTVVECGKELQKLLNEYEKNSTPIEMKEIMARFTTDIIGSCAFGIDCNSMKEPDNIFREQGKKIFATSWKGFVKRLLMTNSPRISALFKLKQNSEETHQFFMKLVNDTVGYREKNNIQRKDFLQLLIQLKNQGYVDENDDTETNGETKKLTLEQIAAQSFVFFLAGFETSSTTLSSLMYELTAHQDVQDKVRKEINDVLSKHNGELTYEAMMEMTYMENVINESMRLHPVAPMTGRRCVSDFTFPGTDLTIKAGSSVFVPIICFHKDPKYFPDPEKFDPDRFNPDVKATRHQYAFLPFGAGPRNCIGLRFAMMQMKIGLIALLKNHRYTLNSQTSLPLKQDPRMMIYNIMGGVWVNVEKA